MIRVARSGWFLRGKGISVRSSGNCNRITGLWFWTAISGFCVFYAGAPKEKLSMIKSEVEIRRLVEVDGLLGLMVS